MEGNDNENKNLFKKIGVFFIIIAIGLLYFIPIWVYNSNNNNNIINQSDWLQYYGTALTGVITGCGLLISFRINAKEVREQRKIDDIKFNKQMKIQIINEKINDYKRCIELINEFVDINDILYGKIEEYWTQLSSFSNRLNSINDASIKLSPLNFDGNFETICKQNESDENVFLYR